jgi:hypothetical protein
MHCDCELDAGFAVGYPILPVAPAVFLARRRRAVIFLGDLISFEIGKSVLCGFQFFGAS